MKNFRRVISPFKAFYNETHGSQVYCDVKYFDGRLSISGVHGPLRGGNARGGCGQIDLLDFDVKDYNTGWTPELVSMLAGIWKRYHLNDINAGSPAQNFFLRTNPVSDKLDHYNAASQALEAAGLNPDPNHIKDGKPYKYGSTWLREDVPTWVLEWLMSLPETERMPEWI